MSCQEGQPDHTHLCTKGTVCVSVATFGLGSLSVALGVYRQGQGYCVERLSLLNVETVENFFQADV